MVEHLCQRVRLGKVNGQLGHCFRKQPLKRTCDARKLSITFFEVMNAIQFIKEKTGGWGILGTLEKIGVSAPKPLRLQPFDVVNGRLHTAGLCLRSQLCDASKVRSYAVGGGGVLAHDLKCCLQQV